MFCNLLFLLRWDNLITKDINEFYEKALNSYKNNLSKIESIMEGDELIKTLFEHKMDAILIYNKLFYFNQDTFNNSQYLAWYNDYKRKLESEIANIETKISDKNMEASSQHCQILIIEGYKTIKDKIQQNFYTSSHLDDYTQDHESFLMFYQKNAKGPQKVPILIDFLTKHKPDVIKALLNNIETENNSQLEQAIQVFDATEKKKIEVEAQKKILDEITQTNTEKVTIINLD
jgi:hypothetical protein